MKTTVPLDFQPTSESIQALIVWGAIDKKPVGDKLIDAEFITRKDIVAEFICFWSSERGKNNIKTNWQTTYRNYIKRIAWPNAIRDFEYNRHKRSDSGSNGFKPFGEAMKPVIKNKPVQLKYKIPERPEAPPGPTNAAEAFELLRRGKNKKALEGFPTKA